MDAGTDGQTDRRTLERYTVIPCACLLQTNKYEKNTTMATELKVTQNAVDVHMRCTPFVKD